MANENANNVRNEMTSFWKEHSSEANTNEMMLDDNAEYISTHEGPEILSSLPSLTGKRVLELGAGIGRFTGEIAKYAKSVVAVDFMETFIKKNEEENGHFDNIEFKQADVTQLKLQANSFDVVFSNWLFMYLTDEESYKLMNNVLTWLDEGGHFFFRESCYHQSGNKDRNSNPTKYRSPNLYNQLLNSSNQNTSNGKTKSHCFKLIFTRRVQAYVKLKNNRNQVCWLMQKMESQNNIPHGYKTFQEFLDQKQYSRNGILRYEKVFGKHFVSTGGKETTEEFVKMLDLKPGHHVIDVGCGIGGSAFYMSEKYGVKVTGIDLSSNMIEIALERLAEIQDTNVDFEVADATERVYPDGTFNVVYSRDTILHIKDKKALFERFLKWLSPGGKLLISDYCCQDGNWSEDFTKYVTQRGYHLLSPKEYGKVLESAGFTNVRAEDKTDMFVNVLQRELTKTEAMKDEFLKEFSQEDYTAIVDGWNDKLKRCGKGDQRWGLFYAEKPKQ